MICEKFSWPLMFGLLFAVNTDAQTNSGAETGVDGRIARTQAKVESLYERGDYKRAHFIYANELAPAGDKYAQYMTGYMYQRGQGVPEDAVLASAWYRLAAERGTPEFVSVRDKLLATMTEEQLARSDDAYLALRGKFSDLLIVLQQYLDERQELNRKPTGSRLSNSSGIVTIVDPHTGATMSLDAYHRRIEARLRSHLDFITNKIGGEPLPAQLSVTEIGDLRERIEAYLAVIDDR